LIYFRWLLLAFSSCVAAASTQSPDAQSANAALTQAQQLVIVVSANWDATQGALYQYERGRQGWMQRASPVPVAIGGKGSAWGVGLHESQPGPQKAEGDGRSPAGLFTIGTAFGYASAERSQLPYQAMTQFDYCIDVSGSSLYNRIVDERVVGHSAIEGSTEPMRRDIHAQGDQRYKLGFVIEHNPEGVVSNGSCIFAHLWNAPGQTTAGCTAMGEQAMRDLVGWLDPRKQPLFVLLPRDEYGRLAEPWGLPPLATTSP
jgi:L,D-peptidoglycan transpeptidase YkuD (ErfK/YbiS/YcfS/YnhG family)